jgi:hypothetical protein
MHEQGDVHVAEAVRAYDAALQDRVRRTRLAATLLPPLGLQLVIERFASADLGSALAYRASLAAHHEQLKQHVYRAVFSARELADFELDELPRHRFDARTDAPSFPGAFAWPLLLGLVLGIAAWRAARRLDRYPVRAAV